MVETVNAARGEIEKEFMTALQRGTMGPELAEQYRMVSGLEEFATEYDRALYGARYGSFGVEGLLNADAANAYDPAKIAAANQVIRENWSQTDDNPIYSLLTNGAISPLLGPNGEVGVNITPTREDGGVAYLTTKAFYPKDDIDLQQKGFAGMPHGQARAGGNSLAADLGTRGYPLTAVAYETANMLAQSSSIGWGEAGGFVQTENSLFGERYVHLANSTAFQTTQNMNQSAIVARAFRYQIPAGYQFGELYNGSNQYSTGTHLHFELLPRWYYF